MKALNAAGLTPIPVISEKRTEPKKQFLKFANPKTENFTKKLQKGLVLFSSALSAGFANALTYEEALQQSVTSSPEGSDFDLVGVFDGITGFATENPLVLAGGAAVVALPLILSRVFGNNSKSWGVESAKSAYSKLGEDENAQLLDIRALGEARQMGSPDLKGLKRKPFSVVYKGEDKLGFLKKLSLKFKEPENTTLFVLDKFDGNSELVAELVTANGYKAAYAIKDGAEGPRGWMNSGLPWVLPKKSLSLDISGFTDAVQGVIGEGSLSLTLGIAAATGLGLLAFTEVETLLQLLGSVALVQVISKKLLFAEDRKQTLLLVDEFLSTKIAPKEFLGEIKDIGKALLPTPVISKSLPAPTEAIPAVADETVQTPQVAPVPQINLVPETEVKAEPLNGAAQYLSPYPYYQDFKPPTSPTPTQP